MRFSEAIEHLINGEYIRRPEWRKDFYIKLEDEIVDSDGSAEAFYSKDIIANDWELYQTKLEVGTVVQYHDGIIGIVLSLSKSDKEYTILNENGCLEKADKTQISSIKNDNELVDRDCKIASKRLKNLISTLEKISELVNEGIW